MTLSYSYLLSLMVLLIITHWTSAASLRSFSKWSLDHRQPSTNMNNSITTSEPILTRRRPYLLSKEREKRWSKDEDNDEVEIQIETNNESTAVMSADISLFNSTIIDLKEPLLRQDIVEVNQTNELTTIVMNEENNNTISEQPIESNNTITEQAIENNSTTIEQSTESNNTISEQSIENNNTTVEQTIENKDNLTTSENIVLSTVSTDINATESEVLPSSNITDVNQEVSNENNASIVDNVTTVENTHNQTIEEMSTISPVELPTTDVTKQDTAIILLDYTTIPPATSNDNLTEIEINTTAVVDEGIKATTVLDITQSNTTFDQEEEVNATTIGLDTTQSASEVTDKLLDLTTISLDVTSNEISTVITDEDEYSNETTTSLPSTTRKPICDRTCQCFRECPYGYEIIKNKCQCDPPCKNYQCYGNDTCVVNKKGQPICQPAKGEEHDRPLRCYQPNDAGYHDADIRYYNRWYYDPNQDTCHLFVYRGLGGNENNFQTLHECHLECITCAPPPDPGNCLGYIPMWYYSHQKKQCLQFQYSGCKGNDNKFLRKQDCVDTCVSRILNL